MRNKSVKYVVLLVIMMCTSNVFALEKTNNEPSALAPTARSYILMEESSGKILLEYNADEKLPPASITKVMTLLLINEAVDTGKINWDDKVTISEHAAHMGGSQVFMEPGEEQTVRDLVKCICIASANDAAVAMSEYIAGSEQGFVDLMNTKAKQLGMENTVFLNACGLHVEGHVSTSRDIAIMSRELIKNHPEITKTLTTWMDTITHKTRRGESIFGLANTNKMLKWYNGITGLKTGYTPQARHCVSATAKRDNMGLVAVIMGAENGKIRFKEAANLLDYGFSNYKVKVGPIIGTVVGEVKVSKGDVEKIEVSTKETKSFIIPKEDTSSELTYEIIYKEKITAPILEGEIIGEIIYSMNGKEIGKGDIVSTRAVNKATLKQMLPYTVKRFFKVSK